MDAVFGTDLGQRLLPLVASSATRVLNSPVCRLHITLPIVRPQSRRD
jgi:hypothetical protein